MRSIAFAYACDVRRWKRNNSRRINITGQGWEGSLYVIHYSPRGAMKAAA